MSKIVISVTGHRHLTAEQKGRVGPLIRKAIENIMFTVQEHDPTAVFEALSPLAEGADTLFAKVALSIGLPLKVILPFEVDEYLKGFSGEKEREEFYEVYNTVSNADKSLSGRRDSKEKDQLFLEMGRKLVDEATFLIAIWNGKTGKGMGGTTDVVTYAIEKKKNILVIDPEDEHAHINYLHEDMHRRLGEREVIDIRETNHLIDFIERKQDEYDSKAVYFSKKYKRVWTVGFVVGLVEVLAFAILVSFHASLTGHFVLASVEFLCILTIIGLVLFGGSKHLHSSYVHYRIISERLRIKKFFARLGFRIYQTSVSPIYFSFKEKPEFSILDNTIRLINLSAWSGMSFKEKKSRLESELIIDQLRYHERKKEKFEKKNRLYKQIRLLSLGLFAGAVTLHFAHVANEFFLHHGMRISSWDPALFHSPLFSDILIFLSMFIPATIAAAEALKYLYEWEKIITLSSAMANYFEERAKLLADIQDDEGLEQFLNGINKDMLIENLDWEKYMHDKNEVPT